jgi:hypothetical protein
MNFNHKGKLLEWFQKHNDVCPTFDTVPVGFIAPYLFQTTITHPKYPQTTIRSKLHTKKKDAEQDASKAFILHMLKQERSEYVVPKEPTGSFISSLFM